MTDRQRRRQAPLARGGSVADQAAPAGTGDAPVEEREERRLPGAVRPDDAEEFAGIDLEAEPFKQQALGVN